MDQILLTPEQAARALSISRSKLYELLADGTIRSIHIGSLRRIPVDALNSFVAEMSGDGIRQVS